MRRIKETTLGRHGFTLIESIVTLLIASVLLMVLYTVLNTSMGSYRTTSQRVDAQSQFRLIIGILEQEVGTASRVELLNEVPETVAEGAACIYVVTDGDEGKFYQKTAGGEVQYDTPYPLKDLTMTFRRGTSQNVLDVSLQARDASDYNGSILVQNSEMIFIDVETDYSVVYYEILNLGV